MLYIENTDMRLGSSLYRKSPGESYSKTNSIYLASPAYFFSTIFEETLLGRLSVLLEVLSPGHGSAEAARLNHTSHNEGQTITVPAHGRGGGARWS